MPLARFWFVILLAGASAWPAPLAGLAAETTSVAPMVSRPTSQPDDSSGQAYPVSDCGAWRVQQTPNFAICWSASQSIDPRVGGDLERLLGQVRQQWLGQSLPQWSPRCHVVLHPSHASYLRETGAAGGLTAGASLVRRTAGRVSLRRIDLRADRGDWSAAAPHELTHLVLADRLADGSLPCWADEGIALLADAPDKRRLHRQDLTRALRHGSQLRALELLTLTSPRPDQRAAFYGGSLSLVEFLLERGTRLHLLDFLEDVAQRGYDAALRTHYQIDGIAALERQWLPPHTAAAVARHSLPNP